MSGQVMGLDLAAGGQEAHRDREVERGAFLAHVCRGEADGRKAS